jgi:prophage regulatory protein
MFANDPGRTGRNQERPVMAEILQRIQKVREATALSRTELYRRIRSGDFPKPVAIGLRAVAWRESDIQAWIAARSPKLGVK